MHVHAHTLARPCLRSDLTTLFGNLGASLGVLSDHDNSRCSLPKSFGPRAQPRLRTPGHEGATPSIISTPLKLMFPWQESILPFPSPGSSSRERTLQLVGGLVARDDLNGSQSPMKRDLSWGGKSTLVFVSVAVMQVHPSDRPLVLDLPGP